MSTKRLIAAFLRKFDYLTPDNQEKQTGALSSFFQSTTSYAKPFLKPFVNIGSYIPDEQLTKKIVAEAQALKNNLEKLAKDEKANTDQFLAIIQESVKNVKILRIDFGKATPKDVDGLEKGHKISSLVFDAANPGRFEQSTIQGLTEAIEEINDFHNLHESFQTEIRTKLQAFRTKIENYGFNSIVMSSIHKNEHGDVVSKQNPELTETQAKDKLKASVYEKLGINAPQPAPEKSNSNTASSTGSTNGITQGLSIS